MTIEHKIRQLLESAQAKDDKKAQQDLQEAEEMGAGSVKKASYPGGDKAGEGKVKQGSSEEASVEELDSEAPGKSAAAKVSKQPETKNSGAGKAPNFTDVGGKASGLAAEEVEVKDEEIVAEEEIKEEEVVVEDAVEEAKSVATMEDIASLFTEEQLTEDFKTKATSLFEQVVVARVEAEVSAVKAQLEEELEATKSTLKTELVEKVDSYLNYVVESWMKENELAIEEGLRNEVTEQFIEGMKNLFKEHYIEVPEEKFDVVADMQDQIEALEAKINEQIEARGSLQKEVNVLKREQIIASISEGLAATEVEKLKSLVESVEFETAEQFEEKVSVVKENYFPKAGKQSAEKALNESADGSGLGGNTVDHYVKALSRNTNFKK